MFKKFLKKFETYDSTTNAIITLINLLKLRITKTTIRETLETHPDYPSLLSISDSLNKWNIKNVPLRVEKDKLRELAVPFVSLLTVLGGKFIIVKKFSNTEVFYSDGNKEIIEPIDNHAEKWSGIVLLIEANETSQEEHYAINRRKEIWKIFSLPIAFGIGIIMIVLSAISAIYAGSPLSLIIYTSLILLINWAGISATVILLWYEIDKKNNFIQKLCIGIAKTNCGAVLSSNAAKLFGRISWSEIGLIYFSFGFLCIFFNPKVIWFISLINLFALPYIFFSIYYQWRIVKQWCVLCLMIQGFILIEFILNYLSGNVKVINNVSMYITNMHLFLFALLLPIGIWYFIKPQLKENVINKENNTVLQRFKFNEEIFGTILQKQRQITRPPVSLGIMLGNQNAKHILVKVCNPYCSPCAKAHPEIEKLLRYKNLKVQIIFTATNSEVDSRAAPVKHLLAIAEQGQEILITKALDDWYSEEKKDYKKFASKYPLNAELFDQEQKIESMEKWCSEVKIEYTPTFFYNGYELPRVYKISDLSYFLAE